MGIQATIDLSRKQAIKRIVDKQIDLARPKFEAITKLLTNEQLERLLDETFYNYIVRGDDE